MNGKKARALRKLCEKNKTKRNTYRKLKKLVTRGKLIQS